MVITSLDNKKIKEIAKLQLKKYRQDTYLVDDLKMIERAKSLNLLVKVIRLEDFDYEFEDTLVVSKEVMRKLSLRDDVKVMAVIKRQEEDILSDKCILLDDLKDPQNVGMIIRLCSAFGYNTLYLSQETCDIYQMKCLNIAKECLYDINIKRLDLDYKIRELQSLGYKVYATGLYNNTKELKETISHKKMAIIMGNEGHGIKEEYYHIADEVVKIAMENIDSLNVAIASGIVMEYYANVKL